MFKNSTWYGRLPVMIDFDSNTWILCCFKFYSHHKKQNHGMLWVSCSCKGLSLRHTMFITIWIAVHHFSSWRWWNPWTAINFYFDIWQNWFVTKTSNFSKCDSFSSFNNLRAIMHSYAVLLSSYFHCLITLMHSLVVLKLLCHFIQCW